MASLYFGLQHLDLRCKSRCYVYYTRENSLPRKHLNGEYTMEIYSKNLQLIQQKG